MFITTPAKHNQVKTSSTASEDQVKASSRQIKVRASQDKSEQVRASQGGCATQGLLRHPDHGMPLSP